MVTTTRRYKGREYHAHLLMRSYREGKKVRKKTLANLTPLGDEIVGLVRAALQGKDVRVVGDAFGTSASKPHGHVLAVMTAMQRLGMERLVSSRPSRERELVLALTCQQVMGPGSKLAASRSFSNTSLAEEFGVAGATEDELYAAMDWLITRKEGIEVRLAGRHLTEGGRVLYDLTSSYVEGEKCALAAFGYNWDKKKNTKQINWGLLTSPDGVPVGLDVFAGNTPDSKTVLAQVRKLRERFGLGSFTFLGDRGMITEKHIQAFTATGDEEFSGVEWITALKSVSIRPLVREGVIQPSLFEQANLLEFTHENYPNERLIACFNPLLAEERRHHRSELLDATTRNLEKIQSRVEGGRLKDPTKIALAIGKVLGRHKMGKDYQLSIEDGAFTFEIDQDKVREEAALDGIYIIRTSVLDSELTAGEVVLAYKQLAEVEAAFKTMKGIELQARPIRHRLNDRVTAHLFITMLAYYVRLHMERAWASLTFKDDTPPTDVDPVAKRERSSKATRKARTKTLPDGQEASSFKTLLENLSTIVKNTHYYPEKPDATFTAMTEPTQQQKKALELLDTIEV